MPSRTVPMMHDQMLAHYRILQKLGEGGMGAVYAAEDTRLQRRVALKVLPPEVVSDPGRLERFEREARVVAALNHPNIVTLYSVDEAEGVRFITMELVEGKSLARLIPGEGFSLDRFFQIAIPLTEALAAAHERGIVHRDLKPSNIVVGDAGQVKVLDFGLAKLQAEEGKEGQTLAPSRALTEEGMVVGTVPYMAPEQVQGKPLDHRADIFSLGTVLYEMLTGRRPFQGETSADVLSAVLRDTPPSVTQLRRGLPGHMGRVIRRCLEKAPERRYQAVLDVRNELEDLEAEIASGELVPSVAVTPSRPWRMGRVALAAGLAVALAITALLWTMHARQPQEPAPGSSLLLAERLQKISFAAGLEDEPTWSPDGRFLAYTAEEQGDLDVVILPLAGGPSIRALAHEADDAQPAWSHDGSRLAFVSARDRSGRLSAALGFGVQTSLLLTRGGDIFIASPFGGSATKLVSNGYYPCWSPDSTAIAYQAPAEGQWDIWRVSATGGEPQRVTVEPDLEYQPTWSPDGAWIAYGAHEQPALRWELRAVPAAGGEPVRLPIEEGWIYRPAWSPDGRYIYFSSNRGGRVNLWRAAFSGSPQPRIEAAERVTAGEGSDLGVSVSRASGRLAFATVHIDGNIWELDLATGRTRQVTDETSVEDFPHMSPDGTTLLALSDRGGQSELWTFDLAGRVLSKLGRAATGGRWSPDGTAVAYVVGPGTLVVQRPGALGVKELGAQGFSPYWSPDGRQIAFSHDVPDRPRSIAIYSLETGSLRQLTSSAAVDNFPSWSPDGRWIVYSSEHAVADRKLWMVPSAGGEARQRTFGDSEHSHPDWSPVDAGTILFLRDHKNLCLLTVATGAIRQLTDHRRAYLLLDYPTWSADGKKIYYSVAEKTGDIYVTTD